MHTHIFVAKVSTNVARVSIFQEPKRTVSTQEFCILWVKGMDIGKRIARIRKEKGWSQKKLAQMTGLSRGYISLVEIGKKNPKVKTLVIIASALGVELKDLYE